MIQKKEGGILFGEHTGITRVPEDADYVVNGGVEAQCGGRIAATACVSLTKMSGFTRPY